MDGCCQLFKEKAWLGNEFRDSSSKGHAQV